MRILHLKTQDYKVSQWSGGTTTEIFLWPEGSSYAARQFQLRISSATVDLAESDFTPLPGVTRYIVPLQGSFTLSHPGQAPVVMEPLCRPYRFSGDIDSHCVGQATDFNLMLKGVDGQMDICRNEAEILPGLTCLYAPQPCRITLNSQAFSLAAQESLVIFSEKSHTALTNGTLICCHAII
jgi:environmental stress-induced protein Ves